MNRYIAYLNTYYNRPCTAQLLWWYYYLIDHLPNTYLIVNYDYCQVDEKRWEYANFEKAPYKYSNPANLSPLSENLYIMNRFEEYPELKDCEIPSELTRRSINEPIKSIVNKILDRLENKDLTAGISWVNNASFDEACRIAGLPSIHNESGALRAPFFKDTCYFDFSGVNGNTEFGKRFKNFKKISDRVKIFSREELLKLVVKSEHISYLEALSNNNSEYECGVAMQVDVDTNVLAFNRGISETDIVNIAAKEYGDSLLIRNHPLSSIGYLKPASLGNGKVDESPNSLEFLSKCKRIYTLNSSVAFEALLMGKQVRIFGDNPFRELQFMNEDDLIKALNFAVFSYLIPTSRLYEEKYYNMRIHCKEEEYLYNEGQRYWLNET